MLIHDFLYMTVGRVMLWIKVRWAKNLFLCTVGIAAFLVVIQRFNQDVFKSNVLFTSVNNEIIEV